MAIEDPAADITFDDLIAAASNADPAADITFDDLLPVPAPEESKGLFQTFEERARAMLPNAPSEAELADPNRPRGLYETYADRATTLGRSTLSGTAVGRGIASGLLAENPQNFGDAIEGFGYLTGSTWAIESGRGIQEWAKTANPEEFRKRGSGVFEARSFDDFLTSVGETFGSGMASTVPSATTGVAGAVAGAAVGGPIGAAIGGITAAGSTSYVQSFGELFGALKAEGVASERAAQLAKYGAVPIASLDVASLGRIASMFTGEARREVVGSLARRIARAAAEGMATEGATETAQEFLKDAVVAYETGQPLFTEERAKGWAEAGVGGALVGGAFGAPTGLRTSPQTQMAPPLAKVDPIAPNLPPPTQDDIDSPIPTALIQQGKARLEELITRGAAASTSLHNAQGTGAFEPLYDEETGERIGWFNPRTNAIHRGDQPPDVAASAAPASPAAAPVAPGAAAAPAARDATAPSAHLADDISFDDLMPTRPTDTDVRPIAVGGSAEGRMVEPQRGTAVVGDGTRIAPVRVETPEHVDVAATRVETAPTKAQKEAGNYQKGHLKLGGMDITIETPKDGERSGTAPDGSRWSVRMPAHYGYVKRSEGADGDQVDVYIGPEADTGRVFVFDQYDPETGRFDEHKAVMGVRSIEEAEDIYDGGFSDRSGPRRRGGVTEMSTDEFRTWAMSGDTSRPLGEPPPTQPSRPQPAEEHPAPPEPTIAAPAEGRETKIDRAKRRAREMFEAGAKIGDMQRTLRAEGVSNLEVIGATREFSRLEDERTGEALEPMRQSAAEPATETVDDLDRLREEFHGRLMGGEKFNISEARKIAAQFLGTGRIKSDAEAAKVTEEVMESAIVLAAREIVAAGGTPDAIFDRLVDLYRRQPLLTTRTSTSVEQQAYSTPAPLAYLASRLGGVTPETTVYEPSAGNGMLLIEAAGPNIRVNEINPARIANLRAVLPEGAQIHAGDGATYRPATKVERVVANPPFGKVVEDGRPKRWNIDGFKTPEIDHAIAWTALSAMADDGRAVLIVGGKQGTPAERVLKYRADDVRSFYKKLYDAYNVVDHFTVDGKLYERQGAGWPVDVIVIDGRGKSGRPLPMREAPRVYASWDGMRSLLDDRVDAAEQREGAGERPVARPPAKGTDAGGLQDRPGGPDQPAGGAGDAGGRAPAPAQDRGDGKPQRTERSSGGRNAAGPGERLSARQGQDAGISSAAQPDQGRAGNERIPETRDAGGISERPVPARDDVAAAFDQVFEELFGEPPLARSAATPASMAPRASSAPRRPSQRSAGEAAASAAKNTAMSLDEIAAGLATLFGGNKVSSGLSFDEETYRKAKPLFQAALAHFKAAGTDVADAMRALMRSLIDAYRFTRDQIIEMRPYIERFISDQSRNQSASEPRIAPTTEPAAVLQRAENTEVETSFQVRYEPTSKARFAVGTLVPRNMQTAMSRALEALQERVGDIDGFVADRLGYTKAELVGTERKNGYFSAEQVDALALSIDNIERGGAFIIGDQTGVGKGRFVAAMLRYALQSGREPVFITKDPGLYADMIRDLRDIGMTDIASRILITNYGLRNDKAIPLSDDSSDLLVSPQNARLDAALDNIIATGKLPDGYEMLFTTYSQLQYIKGAETRRHRALTAIAPQAMFVLDESHEAGGSGRGMFDKDGEPQPTRADFVRGILREANGVVYSSATYAKNPNVMTLYFKTDLSMAVENIDDLAPVIEEGGVPLQQVIANMLVEAGQYARRERSYEGVEIQMDVLPTDVAMAEGAARALRDIFTLDTEFMAGTRQAFIDEAEAEGDKGVRDLAIGEESASSTNFASVMHNVVAQMLLGLKAPEVAAKAIALAKAGEKPIIALSNTNGSILDDFCETEGLLVGDRADISFNTILDRYLRRLRRISLKDANKKVKYIYLTDDQVRTFGGSDALERYRAVERFLQKLDLSALPASPIDYILDRLNAADIKADEITGRKVVLRDGVITAREATTAEKKRVMNAYNAGRIDALVINKSGSTGFSMHATGKPGNDGRQRHMILLQPDPNIDVFMQMLGRIHRTGQIKLPHYTLAVSDLAVEKRAAANLMRKLASLNANTTASKRSAISLDTTDFMNRYGDEVVADFLRENTDIATLLDVHPKEDNDGLASRFTGRLAILPPTQVADIYQQIEQNYTDYVDMLDRMGMNALEAKTLDLGARTMHTEDLVPEKDSSSPFGAAAAVETVDAKIIGKPYSSAEITDLVANARVKTPENWRELLAEKMPGFVAEIDAGIARAKKTIEEALTDRQKEKAQRAVDSWKRQKDVVQERFEDIVNRLAKLHPGSAFRLVVRQKIGRGEEDVAEHIATVVSLGFDVKKVKQNPTAASAIKVRFAVADPSREITLPLSKLMTDQYRLDPIRTYGDRLPAEVAAEFDSGQNEARETRQIITGNLVAGFAAFKKGQIVMFTDDKGARRQGILMPRKFNAAEELARRPVVFRSAQQIVDFLDGGDKRLVTTTDKVVGISKTFGTYTLTINVKGGKPYYLNKTIRDATGEFVARKGAKTFQRTIPRDKIALYVDTYRDELGAEYQTTAHKDEARIIVAGSAQYSVAPAGGDEVDPPRAPSLSDADLREIGEIIARVSGLDTFRTAETIPIPANAPGAKAWGRTEAGRAAAYYNAVTDAITVALDMPQGAAARVAYHESFHRLQRQFLTDRERGVLAVERDRLRDILRGTPGREDSANRIDQKELEAEAFAIYSTRRVAPAGFPLRLRPIFAKLDRIVRAVRNWLSGRGYRTYEDVFEAAARGVIAERTARGVIGTTAADDFKLIGPDYDADSDDDGVPDFGHARRSMLEAFRDANGGLLSRVRAARSWDAVNESIDRWRFGFQDIVIDLKQTQREIVQGLGQDLPERMNAYLAYELYEGRTGPRLERLHEEMVVPLMGRMQESDVSIDDLESFLYARHAPERNARIAEINPELPEGGSGMTDEAAAAILDRFDRTGKTPVIEELAAMVDEIVDFAIDVRVEAGLLSEEQAQAWRETYRHYVPLRGFAEMDPEALTEGGPHVGGTGVNVRGPESRRALGRETRAAEILAHVIMQAQEAIVRAERNRVGQALYELAVAAPNRNFWTADPVKRKAVWSKKLQRVIYQRVHALSRAEEDHTVFLKIDGQEHRVTFNMNNPRARRLAEGMRRLRGSDFGAIVRLFGIVNRYLSAVNTSYNPEFVVTNSLRDLQTATINLQQYDVDRMVRSVLKDYRSALVASTKGAFGKESGEWGHWYREFIDAGGRTYWNSIENVQEIRARLERDLAMASGGLSTRRAIGGVVRFVENVNMGVENALRLATYKAAREAGMSQAQAASIARNVTVNFGRRGAYGPAVNALYLFYNAGIQGTFAILGAMRSARVRKIVAGIVAFGAIATVWNLLAGDDDDDGEPFYDKIPDFEKQRSIIIMLPGTKGRYIKVPMPWGYNAFHALGRTLTEGASGRKKPLDAAADLATTFIDAFNPVGGADNLLKLISPTIVDPIVELYGNRDFAGRPIAPDKTQFGPEMPNAQRYWNSVNPAWRAVTDTLTTLSGGDRVRPGYIDVSPEWLDYIFGVVTGAAGQTMARTFGAVLKLGDPSSDLTINDVPFVRRVIGSEAPWVDKATLYERLAEIEQHKSDAKNYGAEGDPEMARRIAEENWIKLSLEKPAREARKALSDIRKARNEAFKAKDRGRMTAEAYNKRLRELKDSESKIVTNFNRLWVERVAGD